MSRVIHSFTCDSPRGSDAEYPSCESRRLVELARRADRGPVRRERPVLVLLSTGGVHPATILRPGGYHDLRMFSVLRDDRAASV